MTTHSRSNYVIIPHPENASILLCQERDAWTLPRHTEEGAAAIHRAIKLLLGLEVTVLYAAYEYDGEQEDGMEAQQIDVLENHSTDWQLPITARWVGVEDLSKLTFVVPEQAEVMRQWFREYEQPHSANQRRPWAIRGWYETTCSWVKEQLVERAYHIREIEQLIVSDWSCILRIQTNRGALYLKCCDPAFPHEPVLTQALSRLWPTVVPRMVVINVEQNWMLMEDAGQVLDEQYPEKVRDLACWQEIIPVYAGMQIEAISQRDYLLSQGCPDRRLALLPSLFETALADQELWCVGREGGLTHEEVMQLRRCVPRLRAMCEELANYGIPETLHHDDLHAGNIMVRGEYFVFFDWAESCIAHPFYSLAIIWRYTRFFTSEQLDTLSKGYLQLWTAFAPLERLYEAFELAQPLGLLCRGLTWYSYLKSLEPDLRQKYALNWPYWLQLFLSGMAS